MTVTKYDASRGKYVRVENGKVTHESDTWSGIHQTPTKLSTPEPEKKTASKATFGGGYSTPQETEAAVKSLTAKGWNVTGIQQDPRTGEWKVVTEGQQDPDYIARIKSGSGTPVQKAQRIQQESETRSSLYEVNFGDVEGSSKVKIKTDPLAGNFIYNLDVESPEQVQDVRIWAQEHGYRVTKVSPTKGKIELEISGAKKLGDHATIDIRSKEMLAREKATKAGDVLGKKIYDRATPIEKVGFHVRTLLSPGGYEYVGSAIKTFYDKQGLLGVTQSATIDAIFPGIQDPDTVVKSNLSKEVQRQELGLKAKLMGVEIPQSVISAVNNPVVDVLSMAAGGAGFAKIAATKVGAKVLGTTAAKIALTGVGAAYGVERTMKVAQLRQEGRSAEALGTAAVSIAGVAAGMGAFKAQTSHIVHSYKVPSQVKVEMSQIKGASITKTIGKDTTSSKGQFKITEGKLKGLTGQTYSVAGKKGGMQIVKIPAQKIGKTKIPEQSFQYFTKHGTVNSKLKLYWKKSSEGIVVQGKHTKLVGRQKDISLSRQLSVSKGKTKTGQDVLIRKFKAVSKGQTAKKYDLYVVHDKGTGKTLIAEKSILGSKRSAKIDWVDVSIAKAGGSAGSGSASASRSGAVTKTLFKGSTVPVSGSPPSTLNVKTTIPKAATSPAVGVRIVPNVNPTAHPIRVKKQPAPQQTQLLENTPKIIRRSTETTRGRTVQAAGSASAIRPVVVNIQRKGDNVSQRDKLTPGQAAIVITHPITDVDVTQKERADLIKKLEPVIDRVPSQPVTPVNVPAKTPDPKFPYLRGGMIPFLRLADAKFKRYKHKTGVIKNPVPKIEKLVFNTKTPKIDKVV